MITPLIIIPLIGSILISLIKENSYYSQTNINKEEENKKLIKKIGISTALINFLFSLIIWFQFDFNSTQYQFISEFRSTELQFINFNFGIDGVSIYFVLLTTFITPIALLSNYNNIDKNIKMFFISFLILESLQICTFVSLDLLLFYIFFESILPVFFVVILIFGHGVDKVRSALLFFLYTLAGSLPMLLCILVIYSYIGSTDFEIISLYEISLESQKILFLGFFLALAVKTPLWPVYMWLPRAHKDANLGASILLAATVLKFATYGYIRVLINLLPDATHFFSPFIQTIAIITLISASLACIIQQDTKGLVAYSSIAHMAVVVLGLFSNNIIGIEGAILLSLAHGFVSAGMFLAVGGVIYDRTGSRIIPYLRGLATLMPVFTIFFFIFTLANTGLPLTLNYIGEQMALMGIFLRNPIIGVLGASSIVLSAIFSIYLYNRISYGVYSPHLAPMKDISRREFILFITLLIPTVLFGIYPNLLLDSLHASVSNLIYNIPIL